MALRSSLTKMHLTLQKDVHSRTWLSFPENCFSDAEMTDLSHRYDRCKVSDAEMFKMLDLPKPPSHLVQFIHTVNYILILHVAANFDMIASHLAGTLNTNLRKRKEAILQSSTIPSACDKSHIFTI